MLLITFPLADNILRWMSGKKIMIDAAIAYYIPFYFLSGTMMTVYRSIGDTKTLLIINAIWGSANVLLDPVLMFKFKMGIMGSALATGICETASMLHGFLLAKRKWNVLILKIEKPQLSLLKKVVKLGLPSLFDALNWNVSRFIIVKIFSYMGVTAVAVFGVYSRVLDVLWMATFALGAAITTLVGQSLGEKDKEKAIIVFKEGLKIASLMGIGMAASVYIFAYPISALFANEKEFLETSVKFLRYTSFGFLLMPHMDVSYGTLIGGGRTLDTLIISTAGNWAYRILLLFVAIHFTSNLYLLGIIYASFIAFSSMLELYIVRKRKWLHTDI